RHGWWGGPRRAAAQGAPPAVGPKSSALRPVGKRENLTKLEPYWQPAQRGQFHPWMPRSARRRWLIGTIWRTFGKIKNGTPQPQRTQRRGKMAKHHTRRNCRSSSCLLNKSAVGRP